ncbi:hypothetical protein AMAG_04714 [Allomyces macrogynus ATCC 38327]|uniref:Uncharacterized protein n=1 Tax=Allomyces macrogynus (strain ATCC 38327) TaxID=578462 RepID=A0A0L0S683_ALLM3|nr:hypothetical protein AMAG_04714 [Allomyces macrogynus ATCC 38327]|eukprot:KNE57869.1 hypothetical protein AMAG_04714 [Allomyces macrogynus ATCC 38327]
MAASTPSAGPDGPGRDSPAHIAARAVLAQDVDLILAQEAAVFPLPHPLPPRTVLEWTTKCPLFSRIYYTSRPHQHDSKDHKVLAGTLICIVLHEHAWRRLALKGELAEADLVGNDMLVDAAALASTDPSSTAAHIDIGIHVYHIENSHRDRGGKRRPRRHLATTGATVRSMNLGARLARSAKHVARARIHLTANVWNMVEPLVRAHDYVVKYTDGSMALVSLPTRHDFDAFLAKKPRQDRWHAVAHAHAPGDT